MRYTPYMYVRTSIQCCAPTLVSSGHLPALQTTARLLIVFPPFEVPMQEKVISASNKHRAQFILGITLCTNYSLVSMSACVHMAR